LSLRRYGLEYGHDGLAGELPAMKT